MRATDEPGSSFIGSDRFFMDNTGWYFSVRAELGSTQVSGPYPSKSAAKLGLLRFIEKCKEVERLG